MKRAGFLIVAAAVLCSSRAGAQEYGAGFARFLGYDQDQAGYSTSEQFGDRGPFLSRQQIEGAQAVYRSSDSLWMVNGRASQFNLGSDGIIIPQTGTPAPEDLWNLQGGASYRRDLGDRNRWGATASFGSASDQPFLGWHEDELALSAYYQMPSLERNSWFFMLNYSNNRPFANNVPLPGVAYQIQDPDHGLDALIGFPFLWARWRPDPDWTLSAGVFGFVSYFAEAARTLSPRITAYARIERTPLQWLPSDRADETDRLIFDSKQADVGVRAKVADQLSLDVAAGRAFDRSFYEARDAAHMGGVAKATLANATVLRASLAWHWGGR